MKVYLVSEGSYSDYGIRAVFSARDKAEKYMKTFCDDGDSQIEEYDLDPELPSIPDGMVIWFVKMDMDGDSAYARKESERMFSEVGSKCEIGLFEEISMYCIARSKEHAIKILNEKRTQLIAVGDIKKGVKNIK